MKKNLIRVTIILSTLLLTLIPVSASAMSGNGTSDNPYLIHNEAELFSVAENNSACFKLMTNIELTETWIPISSFSGEFDGNNYMISGLLDTFIVSNLGKIHDTILNSRILSKPILVTNNHGEIYNCIINGYCTTEGRTITNARISGVVGVNSETGVIRNCAINSDLILSSSTLGDGATFIHTNKGIIMNCYVKSSIVAPISKSLSNSYSQQVSGFVSINNGTIKDSYSVCVIEGEYAKKYGFCKNNLGEIKNCFYNLSATSGYDLYAKVKTLSDLKKETTFNGWDFENVWGISSEVNDGLPYLLWEYANNSSANVEIIGANSEEDSLKFISEVKKIGTPDIASFGTIFIPLWLFESGSTDVAIVEYENSEYGIKNGQTFGTTLSNIPENAKDMLIVAKSFIKDSDESYIWSTSKEASVFDTTLLELK